MYDLKYFKFLSLPILLAGHCFQYANAIDLSDAVADAISAHPEVIEKVHVYRSVVSDRTIAQSGWKPSVDLEGSTGVYNTESPSTGNSSIEYDSARLELSVTQNLFNGYDTTYQIEQTDARADAALLDLYDTADNIALQTIQAYIDVLKQQRLLDLALENVSSHEEILSQIKERNNSGVGRRSQLQQTEGRVARAYASLVAQQNNLQDSRTILHSLLGRYVEPTSLIDPQLPVLPAGTLDELIDIALKKHPAMKVAESNIQVALADHKRSLSSNYPNVDLRFAYEVGDDIGGLSGDTEEASITLNLNYNLYRGGADQAEQKKKISASYERKEFAARVRRQIINTLRLSWIADELLNSQLDYLSVHVVKAEETVESYHEEFFIGQRDLIDLLDAENELNSALNQKTEAFYDAVAARYRVYEGLGMAFEALNLTATLSEDDLEVARIVALKEDELPLPDDEDEDIKLDNQDHCDNSVIGSVVNLYGCNHEIVEPAKVESLVTLPVNSEPVVADDNFDVIANDVFIFSMKTLLSNDKDFDGDPLRIVEVKKPSHGKLAFNVDRDLVYRPDEDFEGVDSVEYVVTDGKGTAVAGNALFNVKLSNRIDLEKIQLVNFKFNKTELSDVSNRRVNEIIERILAEPNIQIVIRTYTDSKGSDAYNLALSERRARALEKLLIDKGIDVASIFAEGLGEKNPIADNDTPEGQAINRRGEFIFTTFD